MEGSPNQDRRPVLVGVGCDARDLRLLHAAFRVAREEGRPWTAVHVHVPDWESAEEAEQARFWLQEARELGASQEWIKAPTLLGGLLEAAGRVRPAAVILGQNRPRGLWHRLEKARTLDHLRRSCDARIVVLPLQAAFPQGRARARLEDVLGLACALAILLLFTALGAAALTRIVGLLAVPAAFTVALAVIIHRWGWRYSVPATAASTLLGLTLFRDAVHPFGLRGWTGFAAFLAPAALGQLFMGLVDRLRDEAHAVRRLEAETSLLMLLGRDLARCAAREDVARVLDDRIRGLFPGRAWILAPGEGGGWVRLPGGGPVDGPPPGQPFREDPLEPVFVEGASFVSLGEEEGFLRIQRDDSRPFTAENWSLLQAFSAQAALALDRIRWLEAAHREHLAKEAEQTRNTLLGAVSHDLRTPLAAIQGAASSLLLPEGDLPEAARRDLLVMIREESDRLARFLADLLDLTRLESGAVQVRKEWQPLEEVAGAAIARLERQTGPADVRVAFGEDLGPVHLDGSLMEQVFLNILANARRHAPGSPIHLSAWAAQDRWELAFGDEGPGVPPALRARVFEKFFRNPVSEADGGVGLGLAICEAIVRAHGGTIWVEERAGGGACFRITLPRDGVPPRLPDPDEEPPALEFQP